MPCAGPFLAAVTTAAARENFGFRTIAATVAYSVGAAIPMLLIARGGREAAARIKEHAAALRAGSGVVVAAVALGLVFHVDDQLAKWTPGYTTFLQDKIENSASASRELAKVRGGKAPLEGGAADDRRPARLRRRAAAQAGRRLDQHASRSCSRSCAARSC